MGNAYISTLILNLRTGLT